jgi:hypothetical protein
MISKITPKDSLTKSKYWNVKWYNMKTEYINIFTYYEIWKDDLARHISNAVLFMYWCNHEMIKKRKSYFRLSKWEYSFFINKLEKQTWRLFKVFHDF